jgi:hypothetical protein
MSMQHKIKTKKKKKKKERGETKEKGDRRGGLGEEQERDGTGGSTER